MKYRFLTKGESTVVGDEVLSPNGIEYTTMDFETQIEVSDQNEQNKMFRRPITAQAETPFWVEFTPVVVVNLKTEGLSESELYDKVVAMAVEKFKANLEDHLETLGENATFVKVDRNNPNLEK